MDKLQQASNETMTRDELVSSASTQKQRNAFSELMAPKPKRAKPSPAERPRAPHLDRFRDNLGAYIDNPASFPASQVIYYDDDFVAVHDLYPKATVHALLLPRSPQHSLLHPFEAFEDADFLASVRKAVRKLEALVAKELQRKLGHESKADARREAVLNGHVEVDGDELPPGRNWALEVRTGIHAHPSMNHLHIHVFSRDMHSKCVKHRKHYNSFNTPFLVDVADFPLAKDDPRRHPGHEGYLKKDFMCWRCHKSYKNQFQQLKAHLEVEFDEWKRE
ncbi:aprataxin-like protein [Verticillium nonalfalfae]|uniref:Aprataxin-like protein n=1 Tax=Verticillium nonalfalfae TaxID=1051616 RepID=A0A3M9XZE9_9PEZI|nr:aprataxin-like protein [Verticillium nonalfalfae]RNJ53633.1 aprataxin-like protein [Verticillium nonalfalfae]